MPRRARTRSATAPIEDNLGDIAATLERRLPISDGTQIGAWRMVGGLDLTTPRIARHRRPGGLTLAINYEAREEGYRRIDGFERFDGRPAPSDEDDAAMQTTKRNAIGEVTGTGEILGVWRYDEKTYAFRRKGTDDTPLDTVGMYVSSGTGWTEVDLKSRLHFIRGRGTPPAVDSTVTGATSGATAVVRRIVRLKGDYTADMEADQASGFLIIDGTTGTMQDGEILTWTGRDENDDGLTTEGAFVTQAIAHGDDTFFRFDNANLYGREGTERMYGCSGTDYAFEWDGTYYTPLISGVADDTPKFIAVHQQHVFLGYDGGSVVHSGIGDATNFEAVEGASEIGTGADLTGMVAGFRNSLFLFGRNQTLSLDGTSAADWNLNTIDREAGAMVNTAELAYMILAYDDRGVRSVDATEEFGNFTVDTISSKVRPWLDQKRNGGVLPLMSVRVRTKSQYRLFFDDGECLVLGFVEGRDGGIYPNFTVTRYEIGGALQRVIHACSNEDDDGRERIFAAFRGSGYVYELERGVNFDGGSVRAIIRLPYNDFGHPQIVKRFRKISIEADSLEPSDLRIAADFSDGNEETDRLNRDYPVSGVGGRWEEVNWSAFSYSATPDNLAEQRIGGRGRNIAPLIYSSGADVPPHVISGVSVQYELRRRMH